MGVLKKGTLRSYESPNRIQTHCISSKGLPGICNTSHLGSKNNDLPGARQCNCNYIQAENRTIKSPIGERSVIILLMPENYRKRIATEHCICSVSKMVGSGSVRF